MATVPRKFSSVLREYINLPRPPLLFFFFFEFALPGSTTINPHAVYKLQAHQNCTRQAINHISTINQQSINLLLKQPTINHQPLYQLPTNNHQTIIMKVIIRCLSIFGCMTARKEAKSCDEQTLPNKPTKEVRFGSSCVTQIHKISPRAKCTRCGARYLEGYECMKCARSEGWRRNCRLLRQTKWRKSSDYAENENESRRIMN